MIESGLKPLSHKKGRRQPLILLIRDLCVLVVLVMGSFITWRQYSAWYEDTIPTAPIPENSRLLWRQPPLKKNGYPYNSSIARYWYYVRYSTTTPYRDVIKFYGRNQDASPFGGFWVDIAPPVREEIPEDYRYLALEREVGDPPNETIFLIEVSKTPLDQDLLNTLWLCSVPVLFLMGLCIIVYRLIVQIKTREPRV